MSLTMYTYIKLGCSPYIHILFICQLYLSKAGKIWAIIFKWDIDQEIGFESGKQIFSLKSYSRKKEWVRM